MNARASCAAAVLLLLACRPDEKPVPESAQPGATRGPVAAAPATDTFEDPEPPDAQARAEAVVGAPFNRDKTTNLKMGITTIVGRTSELEGIGTAIAAEEDRIEDTLSRLGAKVTETEVLIQLPGSILFNFDSAAIRPDAERALNDVMRVVQSYTNRPVRIDGHTDSIASDDYNLALSQRRAKAVADWLGSHGVAPTRLTPSGLGESKPVATNDTAAGRQLNRRVEVVIARK